MAIGNISDGELGSSVRGKLNDTIDRGNKRGGWGNFVDSTHTLGSPLVITGGTSSILTNNAATGITTYLPTGSLGLYTGGRLRADAVGDEYTLRLSVIAFTSSNSGGFDISIDISAAGDGSIPIVTYPVRMFRGIGSGNAQQYTVDIPYFTLSTFVTNGGTVWIESVTGDTSVYDIRFYIRKVFSGEY